MAEENNIESNNEAVAHFNAALGAADYDDAPPPAAAGLGPLQHLSSVDEEADEENLSHSSPGAAAAAASAVPEIAADNTANAAAPGRKEGHNGEDVGAQHVNERAPNLNIRFFRVGVRQRARERAREPHRRRRRRSSAASATQQNDSGGPSPQSATNTAEAVRRVTSTEGSFVSSIIHRASNVLFASVSSEPIISATLVEEPEVIVAERMYFSDKKKRIFVLSSISLLTVMIIILSVLFGVVLDKDKSTSVGVSPTIAPTPAPTPAPTYDTRPTVQIVQGQGALNCGIPKEESSRTDFYLDLCRAVAAVVLGVGDDKVQEVRNSWFQSLEKRKVDLLITGTTHTIERSTNEPGTGLGYSFSTPYFYDGMHYFGENNYVTCAEDMKRYDECSGLSICVLSKGSTIYNEIRAMFPPDFYTVPEDIDAMGALLLNGTCNVLAAEATQIASTFHKQSELEQFRLGDKSYTKEPLAIVTRPHDREWSDIMNWVMYSLIYGEEQGLKKNETLCQQNVALVANSSSLPFENAVYCVGNYGEIIDRHLGDKIRSNINRINNSTGMHYSIPFGSINNAQGNYDESATLESIKSASELRCGVIETDDKKLTEFGINYCRSLAAAIFYGKSDAVNMTTFITDREAYDALHSGDCDVIVGGKVDLTIDLDLSLTFSTPYFISDDVSSDDVSFYSFVTREDDRIFSVFVDTIVLSTFHASEEGIKKITGFEMPTTTLFGDDLIWALRDAISFSGNYEELYSKIFGHEPTGRNNLNTDGKNRQMLPRPGISAHFNKKS